MSDEYTICICLARHRHPSDARRDGVRALDCEASSCLRACQLVHIREPIEGDEYVCVQCASHTRRVLVKEGCEEARVLALHARV